MCRRIFLNCLGCSVLLLVLAAAVLGVVYFNVTGGLPGIKGAKQDAPPPPPTPAERKQAQQTVDRLAQEFRDPPVRKAKAKSKSKKPKSYDVRISETEANQLLTVLPKVREALDKSEVTGLQLEFAPDTITVHARVPVWDEVRARVSASVRVWAENGKLAYETEAVRLGDFPAPERVRKELDKQLASQFRVLEKRLPGRVDEVKIEEDRLEVKGARK